MEQQPRFRATFQGVTIGWFDTLAEAEEALEKAQEEACQRRHGERTCLIGKKSTKR